MKAIYTNVVQIQLIFYLRWLIISVSKDNYSILKTLVGDLLCELYKGSIRIMWNFQIFSISGAYMTYARVIFSKASVLTMTFNSTAQASVTYI